MIPVPQAFLLLVLLLPGPPAQGPPKTLEALAALARKRAARALKEGKALLERYRPDLSLSWEENQEFVDRAVRALASRGSDLAPLFFPLLDPRKKDPRSRNLAENAGRVLEKMGLGPFVPRLARLLKEGSPLGRALAARLLGRSARPEAAPPLLEALKDPDPPVVASAVLALGELRARKARPLLLALLSTKDPALRQALLRSLTTLGEPADLDRILQAFAGASREEDLFLLLNLVERLGKGNPKAARFCLDLAARESASLALRQRAMEALAQVARRGDKETLTALKKIVSNPLTPEALRRQGAYVLFGLGDKAAKRIVLAPAEQFLSRNSKVPYAWTNRGDVYFNLGLYSKAASDYLRALQLCGSRARQELHAWARLFLCYLKQGKKRDLIRAVRKSRLSPEALREILAEHPELEEAARKDPRLGAVFRGKP